MRKLSFGQPPLDVNGKLDWIIKALRKIETASGELDALQIADNFTPSNVTDTRTFSADMSAVATDDGLQTIADVVGTLLDDLKKRGSKRT